MRKAQNIYIRPYSLTDVDKVLQFELENKNFFQPFSILNEPEFYTYDYQEKAIKQKIEKAEKGSDYYFGIFKIETDELIGSIGLFRVQRGPIQSAIIGYSLSEKHNGKGYTTEAVKLVVDYAFTTLKLHRLEAGVMPHNIGSMRVLEKAGFEKEGIAMRNVKINGQWEDHQILAIINPDD